MFEPCRIKRLMIMSMVVVVVVVVVMVVVEIRQTWDSRFSVILCFKNLFWCCMGTCNKTCSIAVFFFLKYSSIYCVYIYTFLYLYRDVYYILMILDLFFLTGYTDTMFYYHCCQTNPHLRVLDVHQASRYVGCFCLQIGWPSRLTSGYMLCS